MNVGLFVEDEGHRGFLRGVTLRVAAGLGVECRLIERNSAGGRGSVLASLKSYVADVSNGRDEYIDILIVAVDSDCDAAEVRRVVGRAVNGFAGKVVLAIPEPHIERWFLLDTRAPAAVLGENRAANVPIEKCEPDRFKNALRQAFRDVGVDPPAGGVLFGEEIARAMDLNLAERADDFRRFVSDLRGAIRLVASEERHSRERGK